MDVIWVATFMKMDLFSCRTLNSINIYYNISMFLVLPEICTLLCAVHVQICVVDMNTVSFTKDWHYYLMTSFDYLS